MDRIPISAPLIPSLSHNIDRPLWSVMIPVCNCAKFIPEVLNSVLVQAPGEDLMQIEVVDDASTDADVKAMVKRIGKGRIHYFRQAENVGSLRNFETCINRARGRLVHLLHGDDRVEVGFYKKMAMLFQQYPEAGAAFCNYCFINESGEKNYINSPEAEKEGILEDWLLRIAERQRIQYVAIVVRREVYEKLGGFYGATFGEDWEMWVRIARYYPVVYTPEILAAYRWHKGSITWKKAISGKIFQDLHHAMNTIKNHIPEKNRKTVIAKSKRYYALYLIYIANGIWKDSHNWLSTQTHINQALAFSKSPLILNRTFKLYIKITKDILKSFFRFLYPVKSHKKILY